MGGRVRVGALRRQFLGGAILAAVLLNAGAGSFQFVAAGQTRSSILEDALGQRFDLPISPVDARGRLVYPLNNHYALGGWGRAGFARDGALLRDYGSGYENAGSQFTPVSASQLCFTAHRTFVEAGDIAAAAQVRRQADALILRAKRTGKGIAWPYAFPNPAFGARANWLSGMGQGQAIACLAAAYMVSGERAYLNASAKAFAVLRASFTDGGTATRVGKGVFYEEVAGAGSEPAHILNGMIFALAGIWMLDEVDPRPVYARELRRGIVAVREKIDAYVAPGDSLYDLGPMRIASFGTYNVVHVEQLEWLYSLTGDLHFLDVALRLMAFERRIPFRLVASGTKGGPGAAGSATGRLHRVVSYNVLFDRATLVDRVGLIFPSPFAIPAKVRVVRGGDKTVVRTMGHRSLTIELEPRRVRTMRVELIPRWKGRVALSLLTVSNPTVRSLAALSSDLSAYRDVRTGSRSTHNLWDGRAATRWSTGARDPWLLISLGDAGYRNLMLTRCATADTFRWTFGAGLGHFGEGVAAGRTGRRTVLDVPQGARYLLLEYSGDGGCLAEIAGS